MTVIATWDNDPAQIEPFLVCEECGEKLCSVEEGDDFSVLVRVVEDHTCEAPIRDRLEHLRAQLRAENISYSELHELQSLADHIEPGDVELLEAAGVPEHGAAHKWAVGIALTSHRLRTFDTEDEAVEFVGTLEGVENGIYYVEPIGDEEGE